MNISQEIRNRIREKLNIRVQWLKSNPCYLWARDKHRVREPRGVMVHSTGAENPDLRRYVAPDDGELGRPSSRHWNQENGEKCVHAFIGKLASGAVAVYQTLPWTYEGWHCAGRANRTHIGFECCEDSLDPDKLECWQYFQKVYEQAALLTAHLCSRYSLDPRQPGVVICHAEGHRLGVASNHADVLHWWPKFGRDMDDFRADVWSLMEGGAIRAVEIPARLLPEQKPEQEKEKEEEEVNKETVFLWMEEYFRMREGRPVSDWAEKSRKSAVEQELTDGTRPRAFAERQEVTAMVVKAEERLEKQLPALIREALEERGKDGV